MKNYVNNLKINSIAEDVYKLISENVAEKIALYISEEVIKSFV